MAGPLEHTYVIPLDLITCDVSREKPSRCGSMVNELSYSFFFTTSTRLEFWCFLVWFLVDFIGTVLATVTVIPPGRRLASMGKTAVVFILCLPFFRVLIEVSPDEREQLTAQWTGILLHFSLG
jgi:hypothetical protein